MSLVLTPRIYNRDFQWNIKSKNLVDSVSFTPLVGDINDEAAVIHTESFTNVRVKGYNTYTALPLISNMLPTYWRYMSNEHVATFARVEYAKARVESIMASGSKRIVLDRAVPGLPSVSVQLIGQSYAIDRGESTFDVLPALSDIKTKEFDLPGWIKNNGAALKSNLLWDYTKPTFSMNPWIRRVVPVTEQTTQNDVLTTWGYYTANYPSITAHTFPYRTSWTDQPSFGDLSQISRTSINPVQPMYSISLPVNSLASTGIPADNAILMYDLNIPITCSIRKIDDYTFDVDWTAPVRFSYMAASRTRTPTGTNVDLDNWAFTDEVTQVNVVLTGKQFNTDTYDVTYMSDATPENPLKVDETPFLTSRTYYVLSGDKWDQALANMLLDKYAKGKYVIKCSVPSTWLLQQNISVGTTMQVQLQDGSYITRGNETCTFSVHNIEFNYQSNAFKSIITLMEV